MNYGAPRRRPATPSSSTRGKATLSERESNAALADLPSLPRVDGEPVFAEPWQAQAFALAVRLSADGHFTWKEWAAALGGELAGAEQRGEPDDGSQYYHHWLAALERLVTGRGLASAPALRPGRRRGLRPISTRRTVSPSSSGRPTCDRGSARRSFVQTATPYA